MRTLLFSMVCLFSVSVFAQTNLETKDTLKVNKPISVPQIVVKIPFNKRISFGDTAIKVNEVIDSRCPSDVTCIWAGEVILNVSVYEKGKFLEDRKITLGARVETLPTFFTSDSTLLEGFSVVPYPNTSSGKIRQEDYVFNVVWKKLTH